MLAHIYTACTEHGIPEKQRGPLTPQNPRKCEGRVKQSTTSLPPKGQTLFHPYSLHPSYSWARTSATHLPPALVITESVSKVSNAIN